MRPSLVFFSLVLALLLSDGVLLSLTKEKQVEYGQTLKEKQLLVSSLGLTDLALSTEARYTRHPAVTDPLAPFMDHPGAIEHFPSGSFWQAGGKEEGGR